MTRPTLISLLLTLICIPATAAAQHFRFEQATLTMPARPLSAPLPLHLVGLDGRQLAVIGESEGKAPAVLMVYQIEEDGLRSADPLFMIDIPTDALFFEQVSLGEGLSQLVIVDGDGLSVLDAGSRAFRPLAVLDHLYPAQANLDFQRIEIAMDIDGDGRDELLVPNFDGYAVLHLDADGEQISRDEIRMPVLMRSDDGHPRFRRYQPFPVDMDLDGHRDLVFVRDGQLILFQANQSDRFSSVGTSRDLPIEVEDSLWGDAVEVDDDADQSELVIRLLLRIEDIDGDGLPDVLTRSTISEGVFDKHNQFRLHLGRFGEEGIEFAAVEDSLLITDGVELDLDLQDVDGDGRPEFIITVLEIGLMKLIGALLSSSVDIDVLFYRLEATQFSERPAHRREVEIEFDLDTGYTSIPTVALADIDGDGIRDLLVQSDADTIKAYRSGISEKLFERRGETLDISLPANREYVSVGDVDGDGWDDLIARFGPADDDTLRSTLRILFARPGDD